MNGYLLRRCDSIRHRFGPRMMAWFYATHLGFKGSVLLLPMQTFNQPAFVVFRSWVS